MPVYEYRCNDCRRRVSLYIRGLSEKPEPVCTKCGSKNLTRLFSTFARLKTDKDVYENILSDSDLVKGMMANDPRALVEWSRRMEGTEGEKSPEYEEMMERMEKGERWEEVASEMQESELASPETSEPEE
jgi:putative FmdB family regulatory protein